MPWPNGDRVVDHDRALLDLADAEDGHLRLVDDRGAEQRAEHAGVGDRERPAFDLLRLQLLGARASARSAIARLSPSRFWSSACLITGTIRPHSSATAMPTFTSL